MQNKIFYEIAEYVGQIPNHVYSSKCDFRYAHPTKLLI